jgi:hypothetical protein
VSEIDPQKKAALDNAYRAGVLTAEEYQAKLQALAGAPAAPAAQNPAASKDGWATETLIDPLFHLPAYTARMPADWKFEGAVVRTACEGAMPVFRAESPDGLTGVQLMPRVHWTFTTDEQAKQFANKACQFHAPVSAIEQAPGIAASARPGCEAARAEPFTVPGMAEAIAANNQAFARQAAGFGQAAAATRQSGDAASVRVRYNYQGHATEELMTVMVMVIDAPVPVAGTGPFGIIQPRTARSQQTDTTVRAVRAPAGMLDAAMPVLSQVVVQMIPEYNEAVTAFNNQQFQRMMAQNDASFRNILRNGEIAHQNLMARHQSYMHWQNQAHENQRQRFACDMARKDANAKNFIDYISDQTYYLNPETGATVTVRNVPGASGVVARSAYGGWVQLRPIWH